MTIAVVDKATAGLKSVDYGRKCHEKIISKPNPANLTGYSKGILFVRRPNVSFCVHFPVT